MIFENIKSRLEELMAGETNFIANASNFSSIIYSNLKDVNWVGFYLVSDKELILGPFHGNPACIRIPIGKGVCGVSANTQRTIVVDDVRKFPGHIPCDPSSKSEIAIPLIVKNTVYGILDIDSTILNRFSDVDKDKLEELANLLIDTSDMEALRQYYQY